MFKNKKIWYYAVKNVKNPAILLTVTDNKKEADEYINKLLFEKHRQEFESWCYFRNILEPQEIESMWPKYFNEVLDKKEKSMYFSQKIFYRKAELGAIVRMFCGCPSIGCSFELHEEKAYFEGKKKIKNLMIQQFKDYMDQQVEDYDSTDNEDEKEEELIQ